MTVWTYTMDVEGMTGDTDPTTLETIHQTMWKAWRERMNLDHYLPLDAVYTTQVLHADGGEHRKVTLRNDEAVAAGIADKGIIHVADDAVSSKAELFYMDEDTQNVQITRSGEMRERVNVATIAEGTDNQNPLTCDGTWQDLADMSIAVTTLGGDVELQFMAPFDHGTTLTQLDLRLIRDTTALIATKQRIGADLAKVHMHLSYIDQGQAAGSYTYKVQYKCSTAGLWQQGSVYKRYFSAKEYQD